MYKNTLARTGINCIQHHHVTRDRAGSCFYGQNEFQYRYGCRSIPQVVGTRKQCSTCFRHFSSFIQARELRLFKGFVIWRLPKLSFLIVDLNSILMLGVIHNHDVHLPMGLQVVTHQPGGW